MEAEALATDRFGEEGLAARQSRPVKSPAELFETINRERLRRTRDCLTPRQQIFLDLVALLFHTNHPLLPGYISQLTPAGISDYWPTRGTLAAAKKIAKAFSYDRRSLPRFALQGIYLMGSPGTVAYSKTSDFDIWLCHGDGIGAPELRLLHQKAETIERWAAELGLEVHFFLFQAERFKRGETLGLSGESSGSSQFHLLLDEFYRSGLVLAGLKPIWWLVPPEQDHRYEAYLDELAASRVIHRNHYIDFGGLSEIPADEFFGAAVWQLSKSIQSPFKSVQKLLLMEAYAHEYPNIELVSSRYKQAVYAGEHRLNALDPYLQMYRKVEEYLAASGDDARLEVLRRSFYLKAHDKLSRPPVLTDPEWRRAILEELVAEWGWDRERLQQLDDCERWKIEPVLQERRELVKTLSRCYARLSDFARANAGNPRITQTDLNVLGRKLYVAFERKPGKVELVNHGITANLFEDELSLHCLESEQTGTHWVLYRGMVGPDAIGSATSIRRDQTLSELLAWCHFNKLSNARTWWHLFPGGSDLTSSELRAALRYLEQHFPNAAISAGNADALSKAPAVTRAIVIANLGFNPMRSRVRDGDVMTSANSDAFRFGGQGINLSQHFDLILSTSWQEVFCFRYHGIEGLLQALREYLRWSPLQEQSPPPPIEVGCFAPQYGGAIERRVKGLFDEVREYFYQEPLIGTRGFVFEVEGRYHRIYTTAGKLQIESHDSYHRLLAALGEPSACFCEVRFDRDCLRDSVLPAIYAANRPNRIQVFIEPRARKANIYILDERGTLVTQTSESRSIEIIYSHLCKFFHAAQKHLVVPESERVPSIASIAVDFFELTRDQDGRYELAKLSFRTPADDYLPLRVYGDLAPDGSRLYTIYCGNVEFSTRKDGREVLSAAANYIRSFRRAGESYPVYITDIDLSTALQESQGITILQTAHLLNHKKRLEYHLTKALQEQA